MRAVICTALGRTYHLVTTELQSPPLLPQGYVRISVHAAGVNFADSLIISGRYQDRIKPPFIPGFEVSGIVMEVKSETTTCQVGDRIMAITRYGGFAEECIARVSDVFVLPRTMDFIQAAGFPIIYGTSHYSLKIRTHLETREVLVVYGATGGVGLTAVECGSLMKATVIAVGSGAEKLSIAAERGANYLVNYQCEDIDKQVHTLTDGRGADIVYNPIGEEAFSDSLRILAPNGRLLVVGFSSGHIPKVPANILMLKNVSCIGFNFNAYRVLDPLGIRSSFEELLNWQAVGHLRPYVYRTMDLENAKDAVEMLLNRVVSGKIVLTIA